MKKTLFTLALLGALNLAMGQDTDDTLSTDSLQEAVTLTFSNTAAAAENQQTAYGIAFTLGNNLDTSRVTTTAVLGDTPLTQIPSFSTLELQSITLNVRNITWSTTYAYIADCTTKTAVAHASNSVSGSGPLTFNFDDVELNSNTAYMLVFRNYEVDMPAIGASAINASGNLLSNGRGGVQITESGLDTDTSSQLGFVSNRGAINSTAYSPVVTIRATATLPEPATATLTLLALAGLAARRRRP